MYGQAHWYANGGGSDIKKLPSGGLYTTTRMLRDQRNDMRNPDRSKRNTAYAPAIKKNAVRRNYTLQLACCASSATICANPDRSKRNTAYAPAIKKIRRQADYTLPLACCAISATICANPDRSNRNTAYAPAIKKIRRQAELYTTTCMLRDQRNDMRNSSGVVTKPWSQQSAGKSCDDDEGIAERSELVFTSFSAIPSSARTRTRRPSSF